MEIISIILTKGPVHTMHINHPGAFVSIGNLAPIRPHKHVWLISHRGGRPTPININS